MHWVSGVKSPFLTLTVSTAVSPSHRKHMGTPASGFTQREAARNKHILQVWTSSLVSYCCFSFLTFKLRLTLTFHKLSQGINFNRGTCPETWNVCRWVIVCVFVAFLSISASDRNSVDRKHGNSCVYACVLLTSNTYI